MSAPFYSDPTNLEKLRAEVIRWKGTPFAEGSSVAGPSGGADCIGMVEGVNIACGACQKLEYKRLPLDWTKHNPTSPIVDFLRSVGPRLRMLDPEDAPLTGDIVTVRTTRGVHHVGIWISDAKGTHLFHLPIGGTAQRWSLDNEGIKGRVSGIWRIYA